MKNLMRFDIRNKKPKLYNMLLLLAVVFIIILFLCLNGFEKNELPICIVMGLFYIIALVQLIQAFFKQIQYNPYSYNTIYYFGFSLFLISIIISHIILTINIIRMPELYHITDSLHYLLGSAKLYMFFSAPFLIIFSISLCISNISLIRHEGRRFVNILGILLSFALIAGWLYIYISDYYVMGSQTEVRNHELVVNTFASIYLYCECMLIGTIVADTIAAKYEPEYDKDFLIILGCGLNIDGSPTPLLKGRIDRALDFYYNQLKQTGKELLFIPSGGKGDDEVISESQSMKNYLMQRGIKENQIIMEDRSKNTFENMKYSKEKIEAVNPSGKIAFSTTNYHVFRSGLYARRVKMRAVGMGSSTKWYFWPNAAVRELIGLFTEHRLKQAVILISMIVIYTVLTFIVYM